MLESSAAQSGGPGPAALVSHGGSLEMHIFGAYPRHLGDFMCIGV